MFFHINEEMLRKLQEKLQEEQDWEKAAAKEDPGPKIMMHTDGSLVIEDPSLIKATSVLDEPPSVEDIERTSIWTRIGWVPLKAHPFWRSKTT